MLNNPSITRLDVRRCREANLTLPEARLLECVLTHPSYTDLVNQFGRELVQRLERRGYLLFDPLNATFTLSEDGFRALEKCYR